jgi:hypothetical protein
MAGLISPIASRALVLHFTVETYLYPVIYAVLMAIQTSF